MTTDTKIGGYAVIRHCEFDRGETAELEAMIQDKTEAINHVDDNIGARSKLEAMAQKDQRTSHPSAGRDDMLVFGTVQAVSPALYTKLESALDRANSATAQSLGSALVNDAGHPRYVASGEPVLCTREEEARYRNKPTAPARPPRRYHIQPGNGGISVLE